MCERTFEGSPFKGSRSKGSNLVLCPLRRSGHGLSPVPSGERSAPLSPTSSKRTCKAERARFFDFLWFLLFPSGEGRGEASKLILHNGQIFILRGEWLPLLLAEEAAEEGGRRRVRIALRNTLRLRYGSRLCVGTSALRWYPRAVSLNKVPKAMQGTPIALLTAGLLAMTFMGFSGVVG